MLISRTIEAIAEFYDVLLKQKEKGPKNEKRKDAFCIIKSSVNYFLRSCSKTLKVPKFFQKSLAYA